MKKIVITLLAVSFLFGLNTFKFKASNSPPYIENILDLSNLVIYDNPEDTNSKYCLKSIEPIVLEKGETYTFVISEDYFDDRTFGHIDLDYEVYYTFIDPDTDEWVGACNSYYFGSTYAYMSFVAIYSLLDIRELALEQKPNTPNQDIMLYRGGIEMFNGEYTSFKSCYTTINWVYLKDYDVEVNIEDIISSIDVLDSPNVTFEMIEDNYSPNKDKIGEFNIILMANSRSNNKSLLKIIVRIADITPPVFLGDSVFDLELKENMPTVEDVIYQIDVIDNYSLLSRQDIVVVSDNYSNNKNNVGSYTIVLEAKDAFNNTSTKEVTVNVFDQTPPVIRGPREIFRYSTDSLLTNEEIKMFFTVEDNVDGNLTNDLLVEGNYERIPGIYEYILTVSDYSGNTATHNLLVNVLDGNYPVFIDNGTYIMAYGIYKDMTHEDIKNWILGNHENAEDIKILIDESMYLKDKDQPMYVYYSYSLNEQTHYGRILIEPSKEKEIVNIVVISSLIILNIGVLIVFIKRPKIHL